MAQSPASQITSHYRRKNVPVKEIKRFLIDRNDKYSMDSLKQGAPNERKPTIFREVITRKSCLVGAFKNGLVIIKTTK
jgi:hypothetical protein